MQKNMMILLVAIIVIAVVAVVAVVLMTGNKGTTPAPGTPTVPSPQVPPVGPATPQTGGNVICDVSFSGTVQGQQMSMTGTMKMEGKKVRSEGTATIEGLIIENKVIINGNMVYMYSPMFGGWVQIDASVYPEAASEMTAQFNQLEGKSPAEVAAYFRSYAESNPETMSGIVPTYSCRATGDIPDSEFQLPAGVTAMDLSGAGGTPTL